MILPEFVVANARQTTVLSTKGQVILPKAIREHRRWSPGTRLIVEETTDGVLLRREPALEPTTLDQVSGMLKYDGPPATVEEMDEAVAEMFRREYDRD
ncbi:MAG: hypothetical protein ABS78_15485 [Phenylobacterium sp. SCN 70-31]|nr:MAG: hypothetical protein ABS78_15485 [Phenylobacterium sp. SCN 70-31]